MRLAQLEQHTPFSRVRIPVYLLVLVYGSDRVGQIITENNNVSDVVMLVGVDKSEWGPESRTAANKISPDARETRDQANSLRLQGMFVLGEVTATCWIAQDFYS